MDIRLALMCGTDIPVPECQIAIHQPRINEIALIGEEDFFSGIQTICLNKNLFAKDESDLANTNNFQIFMTIMSNKEAADKKRSVQSVCTLLFPNHKLLITPRSLILNGGGQQCLINEDNFEALQAALTQICCLKIGPMDQQSFNPANKKAQEIAQKLMRGRERVAAEKGQNHISILSQYLSTITIGVSSMSLQNAMDLTIFQLYDLVERYMLYINWDIDARARLAGAKPESQPDNWMKNIH